MMYVKEQLGHSSINVTVGIYGHFVSGGNKEAVDRLYDVPEVAPIRTQNEKGLERIYVSLCLLWCPQRDSNSRPAD